jgi:prepilin-type N-terminal cleavage/methylation domain-containing protein
MQRPSSQSGFTLVEIAIVLVIVGLLLGAVLKGQELVFNSKVKATFNLSKEFSAAINGYQDRFRAVPGDDPSAASRFPSFSPVPTNGNGDGGIGWSWPCKATATGENCQVFLHLRAAGFITGNGAENVKTPFAGNTGIASSYIFETNGSNNPTLGLEGWGLTHRIAQAIDVSFDDGNPTIGSVRCRNLPAYDMNNPNSKLNDWCNIQL